MASRSQQVQEKIYRSWQAIDKHLPKTHNNCLYPDFDPLIHVIKDGYVDPDNPEQLHKKILEFVVFPFLESQSPREVQLHEHQAFFPFWKKNGLTEQIFELATLYPDEFSEAAFSERPSVLTLNFPEVEVTRPRSASFVTTHTDTVLGDQLDEVSTLMQIQEWTQHTHSRHIDRLFWQGVGPVLPTLAIMTWLHQWHLREEFVMNRRLLTAQRHDCIACICQTAWSDQVNRRPLHLTPIRTSTSATFQMPGLILTTVDDPYIRPCMVDYYGNGELKSGTILVNWPTIGVPMIQIFSLVAPIHRCDTTAWCYVQAEGQRVYWPDYVRIIPGSHLYVVEIEPDPPDDSDTEFATEVLSCTSHASSVSTPGCFSLFDPDVPSALGPHTWAEHQTEEDSDTSSFLTRSPTSNSQDVDANDRYPARELPMINQPMAHFEDDLFSAFAWKHLVMVAPMLTKHIDDDRVAIDYLQQIADLQTPPQQHQVDLHEEVDHFDWNIVQQYLGISPPQEGDSFRIYRPILRSDGTRMLFQDMFQTDISARTLILLIETFWTDLGPYPRPFNEWRLRDVYLSFANACSQGLATTNHVLITDFDATLDAQEKNAFLVEAQWLRYHGVRECFLQAIALHPIMTSTQLLERLQIARQCRFDNCRVFRNGRVWPLYEETYVQTGSFVAITIHEASRGWPIEEPLVRRDTNRSRSPRSSQCQRIDSTQVAPRVHVACFSPRLSPPRQSRIIVSLPAGYTYLQLRDELRPKWRSLGPDNTWAPVLVHPSSRQALCLQQFEHTYVLWDYNSIPLNTPRRVAMIETIFAAAPSSSVSDAAAYAVSRPMYGLEIMMITNLYRLCTGPINYRCELWFNGDQITPEQIVNTNHGDFARIIVYRSNQLASYALVYSASHFQRIFTPAEIFCSTEHLVATYQRHFAHHDATTLPWDRPMEGLRPPGNGVKTIWLSNKFSQMDRHIRHGEFCVVIDELPLVRAQLSLSEALCSDPTTRHPISLVSHIGSARVQENSSLPNCDPLLAQMSHSQRPLKTHSFQDDSYIQCSGCNVEILDDEDGTSVSTRHKKDFNMDLPLTPDDLSSFLHAWHEIELETFSEELFRHMHNSARDAILKSSWTPVSDFQGKQICFYVDGSFSPKDLKATWAFLAVGSTDEPDGSTLLGWSTGKVEVNSEDSKWLGANKTTAFVAETTALFMAAWFALSLPTDIAIYFGYDNMSAAKMASGDWKQNPLHPLVKLARATFQLLEVRCINPVRTEHIPAHTDHPWNEFVDSTAKWALTHDHCSRVPNMDLRPWLIGFRPVVEYLSFCWKLFTETPEYPACYDATMTWQRWETKDFQEPDFVKNATMNLATDMTICMRINLVSYNVCSLQDTHKKLHDPWKAEYLRAQCEWKNFHIVALQETRNKDDMFLETPNFYRFASTSANGQGGAELWFNRNSNIAPKMKLTREMFQVVLCTPHLIAVTVESPWLHLLTLSCHAPHSTRPSSERIAWWNLLGQCLQKFSGDRWVFCLGDFNVQLGQTVDKCIGEVLDDDTNHNGTLAIDLWMRHQLFAPATYADIHQGPSGTWFSHAAKAWKRLDHVVLSNSLMTSSIVTWVDQELHAGQINLDHIATCTAIEIYVARQNKQQRRLSISRSAISRSLKSRADSEDYKYTTATNPRMWCPLSLWSDD